ncbi:2-amino-4-hydroxy-6-hydroxymethyldihydropteridine diphosphokinase [Orrella sp. NBD-18]|uniref:2-amino-4-hydroxy-6-hydroxymethyldihydropteridine pyrophosphokinase n=1 Tax=Sheuella amnicola TaxID=2707330 RepID=A0A6B2R156_9BURK|nr:2-amino-4-hydroxy-6-hydroxymethyldihydropteridine diphosphokinase [Sheuella amnicola]NDY83808.1 2-amino-4-hydroxy-6-hydroxymethyldihydropteridine diphosphokinase [Sheuella amnicola]
MNASAYIGLGANLGDAKQTLLDAVDSLRTTSGIFRCVVSPFYASDPIDATGPTFVNAVAHLETSLAPLNLLDELQRIENRFGRLRPYRNAPRTLDMDLLLYDKLTINTPRLTLPHPRMHLRAFVLKPLQDLAPDAKIAGRSLHAWLENCRDQNIRPLKIKDPTALNGSDL